MSHVLVFLCLGLLHLVLLALPAGRSLTYARAAANACGEVASASNSGRLTR